MRPNACPLRPWNTSAIGSIAPTSAYCSSACPALRNAWPDIPSFTAASVSLTTTNHYKATSSRSFSPVHWRQLGLTLDDADFTDTQAITAIARITGGNFRLLHRLFVQIERVLRINDLTVITNDVVEAARSTLVIGAT